LGYRLQSEHNPLKGESSVHHECFHFPYFSQFAGKYICPLGVVVCIGIDDFWEDILVTFWEAICRLVQSLNLRFNPSNGQVDPRFQWAWWMDSCPDSRPFFLPSFGKLTWQLDHPSRGSLDGIIALLICGWCYKIYEKLYPIRLPTFAIYILWLKKSVYFFPINRFLGPWKSGFVRGAVCLFLNRQDCVS